MRIVRAQPKWNIKLGRLGENDYTVVAFDVSDWLREYPDAAIGLYNQRPGEDEAYPVADIETEGGTVRWRITSAELIRVGQGKCELVAIDGGTVAKSEIYDTIVLDALTGSGEAPEPWVDWQKAFVELKGDAEQAAQHAQAAAGEAAGSAEVAQARADEIKGLRVEAKTLPADSEATAGYDPETGVLDIGVPMGRPGIDGISPTVTVTDITSGHNVTITDAEGSHSFDVPNGENYVLTAQDKADIAGLVNVPVKSVAGKIGAVTLDAGDLEYNDHDTYDAGTVGARLSDLKSQIGDLETDVAGKYEKPAVGIPASDLAPGVIPAVPVKDVQVDGTSILKNGIANVPVANTNNPGAVKVSSTYGTQMLGANSNIIGVVLAGDNDIKGGVVSYKVVNPGRAHAAAFYGLAKAAGHDEKDSILPIGQYTDEAKDAIQTMLDVPAKSDIPTKVSELSNDSGYLTSYTETDPTVPQWAKASTKPSYTAAEVGALPSDTHIPSTTAELTNDAGFITVEEVPEVPVQDVQVNGTSIVDGEGVANVPLASSDQFGAIKLGDTLSINAVNKVNAKSSSSSVVKLGTASGSFITPEHQHESAFYGLAKAAGANMRDISDTTVGTYPDAQKEAIQSMLGISQMLAPTNPNLVATQDYSIGDVFAANGKLYKATAAIAQNGAIIPDTNCVETTMVDAGGKIKDVQVAGSSVVGNDGVANVPLATNTTVGLVQGSNNSYGITIGTNGNLKGHLLIYEATQSDIKTALNHYRPIVPATQYISTFYGLSKVAGVDLANETVTLGTYPETSKTAIKTMLGVQDGLKVVRLI